jgi:hypothetical protein
MKAPGHGRIESCLFPASIRRGAAIALLSGAAALGAHAQDGRGIQAFDAIGVADPVGSVCVIHVIDLATGETEPYMAFPIPAGFGYALSMSGLPGNRLIISFFRDTSTPMRAIIIDPLTDAITDLTPGAPLNARYSEALEWSPRHNALLVSYGNFGSFATTSIALMDESGTVLATAASSPSQGDLDYVACDATRDIFIDLNRTPTNRVLQLATPFPTPTFSTFASPPVLTGYGDIAIHPADGRIYFVYGAAQDRIAELVGNAYVQGPVFAHGFNTNAFAIVTLPPRIHTQPVDTITCPGGTATLTLDSAGGSPSRRWRRLVSGSWVELTDGPTGTGSTISGSDTQSLSISNFSASDEGDYSCILFDTAAPAGIESESAYARVCGSNYNCDGLVDILDFLDFIEDFSACEGTPAPCGSLGTPDINGDTFVDILDFLDFFDLFAAGC